MEEDLGLNVGEFVAVSAGDEVVVRVSFTLT